MKKYAKLFSTYFAAAIEYRANLVGTVVLEAISVSSVVILWLAVYRNQQTIGGYQFSQAVAYYLSVPLIGFMTQVVLSDQLGGEIRNGAFSNYLLRPARFWLTAFVQVLATKLNYLILVSPVIIVTLAYLLAGRYLPVSPEHLCLALGMAGLGFLLHFILDLFISFCAFWLNDVWAFKHIKNIFFSVFGGLNFPLDFAAAPLKHIIDFMPFKFLYYVPIGYLLGRRGLDTLGGDLLEIAAWTAVFGIATMLAWRRGVRRYEAYGH